MVRAITETTPLLAETSLLVCFSAAVIKHQPKAAQEGFLWLTKDSPSSREGRTEAQSKNLWAGTEAETLEEFCLLAYPQPLVQSLFLYSPGPPA